MDRVPESCLEFPPACGIITAERILYHIYAQSDPVEALLPPALMGNYTMPALRPWYNNHGADKYTLPDKMEKFLQPERSAPLDVCNCNMSTKGEMLYIWTG